MFFSKSTTKARKQHIKEALGIPEIRNCIWVFHPLLAEKKNQVLNLSMKEFGRN